MCLEWYITLVAAKKKTVIELACMQGYMLNSVWSVDVDYSIIWLERITDPVNVEFRG